MKTIKNLENDIASCEGIINSLMLLEKDKKLKDLYKFASSGWFFDEPRSFVFRDRLLKKLLSEKIPFYVLDAHIQFEKPFEKFEEQPPTRRIKRKEVKNLIKKEGYDLEIEEYFISWVRGKWNQVPDNLLKDKKIRSEIHITPDIFRSYELSGEPRPKKIDLLSGKNVSPSSLKFVDTKYMEGEGHLAAPLFGISPDGFTPLLSHYGEVKKILQIIKDCSVENSKKVKKLFH